MSISILTRAFAFLTLWLVQVMVCNHIHIMGYASPLIVVYLIITARNNAPRSLMLIEAFLIGLLTDISTNTPGMAAAAFTLTAFFAPALLRHIADPDKLEEDFTPSVKEMGWWRFLFYAFAMTFSTCMVYYLLAWFSFADFKEVILNTLGSTLTTLILIAACERIRLKRE